MNNLSYAVIGTGAVGGYYGGRLQQAGCEVHFLLRSDYEQVRSQGLIVESIAGDFMLPQVNAYRIPADIPPVDVALIALKTSHNSQIHTLLPKLKPNGVLLFLQNGFGIESAVEQHLKKNSPQQQNEKTLLPDILGGLCFICSNKVGPGHIRHIDYGRLVVGAHQAAGQPCEPTLRMRKIAKDFTCAKVPTNLTNDLPMARWRKLVWNVPFNGLSVLLNASTDEMMADSNVRSLIRALMEEVVSVANSWGEQVSPGSDRHLDNSIVDIMLAHTENMLPYRTSMKIDYDEKRPLELAAILGNPIIAAKSLNIATPKMEMLYQQLTFLNVANKPA